MSPPRLLSIPPELRNEIFQLIMPETCRYTFFTESLKHQPALVNVCPQLRAETRAVYFSSLNLVMAVQDDEFAKFLQFIEESGEDFLTGLRNFSFTLDCIGLPEICCDIQNLRPHSVVLEIALTDDGSGAVTESHGVWSRDSGEWRFEAVRDRDHFGLKTCRNAGLLQEKELVAKHTGESKKARLLEILGGLCGHPLVAHRIRRTEE